MSMVFKDDTIIQSRFENQSRKGSVIQWHPRNARFLVSHPFCPALPAYGHGHLFALFVTLLFRGRLGLWKSRHRLVLGWLVCMQALFPGRKTWEELARWSPAGITAWRFRRVLKAVYWDVHLLVTWWGKKALQTLPPQGWDALSRGRWQWETQAGDAESLGPKRAAKRVSAVVFRAPICPIDGHMGRLAPPRGLSSDTRENLSRVPDGKCVVP
jgi:hypothetical protein